MNSLAPWIRARIDRIGIAVSCACAVHCVATVMLVTVLGLGGSFLENPLIHRVGLLLAIVVAGFAIGLNALRHRHLVPIAVAGVGLCLMAAGLFVPHGPAEAALTVTGVFFVASGHLLNLRQHA